MKDAIKNRMWVSVSVGTFHQIERCQAKFKECTQLGRESRFLDLLEHPRRMVRKHRRNVPRHLGIPLNRS
jgi:hypothetical protein